MPRPRNATECKTVSMYLPVDVIEVAKLTAELEHKTLSTWVAEVLTREVRSHV